MRCEIAVHTDAGQQQRRLEDDVRRGLGARRKSLPPKYFYDRAGSVLFERITEQPEYYQTRTEATLLEEIAPRWVGNFLPDDIVEIGSGTSEKTRRILDVVRDLERPVRYVPVDVDRVTLESTAAELLREYPSLHVHAVAGDFERDLGHVPAADGRRLVVFLGSTIGNLPPPARTRFLDRVRHLLAARADRFLLGVDLVKDVKVLEAAYDDAAGVTAAFNRNILQVVNRGVDGDFDPEAFAHVAFYNRAAARVEMHLVAETAQQVRLARLGMRVDFPAGDHIWTESSYKFTRPGVEGMLARAGMRLVEWCVDPANYFALAFAGPV